MGTNIRCHWSADEISNEQLAFQSGEFARRLQQIDPLLSEIGWIGKKDGLQNMLKAPLVSAISAQDWNRIFDAERSKHGFISVSYWNRRRVKEEYFGYNVTVNESYDGNRITTQDLAEPLNNAACISDIVAAAVDVFRVDEASVFTLWHSDPTGWVTRHWRLWLRDGEAWPSEPRSVDEAQGPYGSAEPWRGGTLYTWPEFEPWDYLMSGFSS